MLKPSKSANSTATRSNASRQPEKTYDAFFRFRPVAFMDHLVKLAESQDSAKGKRDTYTDAIRRACLGLVASKTIRALVLFAGGLSVWYLLSSLGWVTDETGRADPNWVVAIVTTIMTVTAYLQWRAINVQSAEFIKQNDIMIRQTDALVEQNTLAREQLAQQRDQMKLENRAWLGIIGVELKPLMKGCNKVRCTITVKNSGKTQGKIISGLTNYFVRPMDYPEDGIRYEFEREPLQDQVHLVYPGEAIIIERKPLGEIDDDTIEEIRVGLKQLHVLANFRYRDVSGDAHEEKGFFTFAGVGPDHHRRANYCSVY